MKIEQLYTKCLAQGAYYIESNGEAAIIDPLREVNQYIQLAKESGATIKYIFETHFHADFVSGHVTLAKETGATIVYGPNAKTSFDAHIATDCEEFKVGDLTIRVIHTPGHTLESSCYLLIDKEGNEQAIFTGDTLFLGDVGRPDLAQKGDLTQEDLAGMLFDSLRNKTVYPGHGAGSACGKNMSKETVGNLGDQKKTNYALRADMTKEEFITELTDGLTPPPAYFPLNVQLNKNGYEDISQVISKGKKALSLADFKEKRAQEGVLVLDVRHQKDFSLGHVPDSIFIGLDGSFAPWVGAIIKDINTPVLLVTPQGREEETIIRLARVGFDNVIGYLDGGIQTWVDGGELTAIVGFVTANELAKSEKPLIFDVRKDGEFNASHIDGAIHVPLSKLEENIDKFPETDLNYVHCAGGYRSVIAISILKKHGIHSSVDVLGGYGKIKNEDFAFAEGACSMGG